MYIQLLLFQTRNSWTMIPLKFNQYSYTKKKSLALTVYNWQPGVKAKKKKMCVYGLPTDPNFWPRQETFLLQF